MSLRSLEIEKTEGGMAQSAFERLTELLTPPNCDARHSVKELNPNEKIRGYFFKEGKKKGIVCHFFRGRQSILDFRLLEDGLAYIGARGFSVHLGDTSVQTEEYLRIYRAGVRAKDRWILPRLANYAVALVDRSIQEKKIPDLTLQFEFAPETAILTGPNRY